MISRNKLQENCADLAVPAINDMIKDIKNSEAIQPAEHRFYNIQTHITRATAVIASIANMVLMADNDAKIVDSRTLIRSVLDDVVFLGQAQSLPNNASKINVRTILTEDTKHTCNLAKNRLNSSLVMICLKASKNLIKCTGYQLVLTRKIK